MPIREGPGNHIRDIILGALLLKPVELHNWLFSPPPSFPPLDLVECTSTKSTGLAWSKLLKAGFGWFSGYREDDVVTQTYREPYRDLEVACYFLEEAWTQRSPSLASSPAKTAVLSSTLPVEESA